MFIANLKDGNDSLIGKFALNRLSRSDINQTIILVNSKLVSNCTLRERLRSHKVFTKDQCFLP